MAHENIFKPENMSIKEVFGNTDSFYQMPEYQRPYSWDKERVEQLWFDIVEAYNNHEEDSESDANYFLGSVVLVKKDRGYDVVDGQQRMTTLTILFCVLRDLCNGLSSEKYIKHSIKDLINDKQRLKLTTQSNNQALFETTIINGINFSIPKKDLQSNRFLQTAFYFKDLITESKDPNSKNYIINFDNFVSYILEKTTLIRIVCSDENFAIKLFTVLNDRGLDLTSADIVKAYLMQKLDEEKRIAFVDVWKRIENLCNQMDETMQLLLSLYLYYLKNGNPKRTLHEELKDELKNVDPLPTILSIEKFAKYLYEINTENKDKDLSKLRYLSQSIYWKTILIAARLHNYESYNELKSLLVKYYYQSWIADGTSNRIKQPSFNFIKKVKDNKPIEEIKDFMLNDLKKYPSYLESLDRSNIYHFKWHKPLLLSIEYNQQDERDYIEIKRDLHTEHILPKEWMGSELNWREYFSLDTAEKYIDSLGNLTLLSGNKNIRASNQNFQSKKRIYEGKGLDGKTSFEITKRIIEKTNAWTEESIIERKRWLIQQARLIFDIS
jgi:hypothetical protein